MAPVAAAPLCRRRRADRWRLRNGASPARRLCRWLRSGGACVDEPGPETIGAIGDGPAAAISGATWAAVVVRVCGRCGVVGGLVRVFGGSNRGVGGHSRVVGGSDRSGMAGTAAWAAATVAWVAGTEANKDRTDGAMEQRSAANLGRSNRDVGLYTAARKKVTKNVRGPNERRRRMVPHVGINLPSAPESCGPVGGIFEWCGRQCFGVGGGGPGPQGVLQPPVEPLDQPVGLRMVSCRRRVLDVEQTAQARPEGGRELGPSV
jgi:hypothetical protein